MFPSERRRLLLLVLLPWIRPPERRILKGEPHAHTDQHQGEKRRRPICSPCEPQINGSKDAATAAKGHAPAAAASDISHLVRKKVRGRF